MREKSKKNSPGGGRFLEVNELRNKKGECEEEEATKSTKRKKTPAHSIRWEATKTGSNKNKKHDPAHGEISLRGRGNAHHLQDTLPRGKKRKIPAAAASAQK